MMRRGSVRGIWAGQILYAFQLRGSSTISYKNLGYFRSHEQSTSLKQLQELPDRNVTGREGEDSRSIE